MEQIPNIESISDTKPKTSFQVVMKLLLVLFKNEVDNIGYAGCQPQKLEKKITRLRLIVDFFYQQCEIISVSK